MNNKRNQKKVYGRLWNRHLMELDYGIWSWIMDNEFARNVVKFGVGDSSYRKPGSHQNIF